MCSTQKAIHRIGTVKSINVNGPNDRYELDLTYLNPDFDEAFGVKYLLCIIDYFSPKAMIYKKNYKIPKL